jgi:bifunctional UDP-N-acetylglucosamine pyrophosphorylase/glucosamine-1-phosphate N-acetyltransferase
MEVAGIVLAAGKGTRMKSDLPKGLHKICGVPMVELVASELKKAGVRKPIVVIGHGGNLVIETLGDSYEYAWQREQKGTGHAVIQALPNLEGHVGPVIITPGDAPLISAEFFNELIETHVKNGNDLTMAIAEVEDTKQYGRVITDSEGRPIRIVEHKDATPEERKIKLVNPAVYCVSSQTLRELLPLISDDNQQGEIYLTDIVRLCTERGGKVEGVTSQDPDLMVGVNDRWELAEASMTLRKRILKELAKSGVTIIDPNNTYVEPGVQVGVDVVLEPGTVLEGNTKIGARSKIGPYTKIQNCEIGEDCVVLMSHLNKAKLGDRVRCGPFANLRPGAQLGSGSKIGNFVEVKNCVLEENVSASHLSYLGDGFVGSGTNIGAGTIFCNYNGFQKNSTILGKNVFVGSNSTLIAPINIGDGAIVGAGSVLSKNVKADSLALGRAKQEEKEGWAPGWRERKKAEKEN